MKLKHYGKLAAVAGVVALSLCLTGCYIPPDEISDNTQDLTVGSQTMPFNTVALTNSPTPTPYATPTPTATPNSTINNLWSTNSPYGTNAPSGTFNPFAPTTTAPVNTSGIAVYTSTPTDTPAPTALRLGSSGADVRAVQQRLKELGYLKGNADGDFGAATEAAVKAFQKQNGLEADGLVGKQTLNRLNSASAYTAPPGTPTPSPTPRVTATPKVDDDTYLEIGSSGTKVRTLQNRLIELGWLAGQADGYYGGATEYAVKRFQSRTGLVDDGVAGPDTLRRIYANNASGTSTVVSSIGVTLRKGDDSASVRALQTRLISLGYLTGYADGSYGTATEEAVKLFQRQNGLTADGAAGTATLNKIYSSTAKPYSSSSSGNSGNTGNSGNSGNSGSTSSSSLRNGDESEAVRSMQSRLINLGYLSGTADGKFGDSTEEAVRRFQRKHNLTVDGVAGTTTLNVLYSSEAKRYNSGSSATTSPSLRKGDESEAVRKMQSRLISLGYLSGSADGKFGESTEEAVKRFQRNHNLTADGVAGSATLDKLYSSSAKHFSGDSGTSGSSDSLRKGDESEVVRSMQTRLKSLGYYSGSTDGKFGDSTEEAVKRFQRYNGLYEDGVAGAATLDKLYSTSAKSYYGGSGSSANTNDITSTGYITLREGDKSDAVETLQRRLKNLGYYDGYVDGTYGSGTTEAVKAYQKANNLKADGIAGPSTQRALYGTSSTQTYSTLRLWDEGSGVKNMQYTLYELGYYDDEVDGIYGETTADAVRAFQIANDIEPVDGIAGNKTLQKLYSANPVKASQPTTQYNTLRPGDRGNAVVEMQEALKRLGYLASITGTYDSATETAVRNFQNRNGLTPDGVAGNQTQQKLYSNTAKPAN